MKVLLAGTSFQPAYGGPAYSVPRLAMALADVGIEVGLWAPAGGVDSLQLPQGSAVRRLACTAAEIPAVFGLPDVVHDNGIWLRHNHRLAELARKWATARLVSPRGMLEPWAFSHKRWKKKVAWALYQRRDLMQARALHASSATEAASIEAHGLDVRVCTIGHGVDMPEADVLAPKRIEGPRTALFLGRLYPVKGLPLLIDAWSEVRPKAWRLRIAGPDEAGHRAQLENRIRVAGMQDTITFTGPVEGAAKSQVYREADLFVLPSHSESFGLAAAEALAHGLPVIATRGTPWQLLEDRRCGWWVSRSIESLSHALRAATSADPAELAAMGRRGRELMSAEFTWSNVASQFAALYSSLIR